MSAPPLFTDTSSSHQRKKKKKGKPKPENTANFSGDLKPSSNAFLEYLVDVTNGTKRHVHALYLNEVNAVHALTGDTAQSRWTRHFYPRTYAQGVYNLTVHCTSQEDLGALGTFVRRNHRALISRAGNFAVNDPSDNGYRRLMLLAIPGENIMARGWVPNIMILKKGVFEPAPIVSFDFFVAFDHNEQNFAVSKQVKDWAGVIKQSNRDTTQLDPSIAATDARNPDAPAPDSPPSPDSRITARGTE